MRTRQTFEISVCLFYIEIYNHLRITVFILMEFGIMEIIRE